MWLARQPEPTIEHVTAGEFDMRGACRVSYIPPRLYEER